ncbi:hypothetical protein DV735_g1292, partial [Chaetothyriales sp. CBS 134920]
MMGTRLRWPRLPSGSHALHTAVKARQRCSDIWVPQSISKNAAKPDNTTAHLINAGFLYQPNAGIFHFLPLGLRVLEKVERLVDRHMRSVGASKVALSSLSRQSLWQKSGRLSAGGELFKLRDRSGVDWLLAPTHEEEFTEMVRLSGTLRKSSSLRLYQIGRKYRDELRPRGGLLRGKEFIMKDLYTFDREFDAALKTYDEIRAAYRNFFDELGLPYSEARADSGSMGGNLSHEYHLTADEGEDTVITCSSCDHARNIEFVPRLAKNFHRLTNDALAQSKSVWPTSPVSRDFISEDKNTLVRVLVNSHGRSDSETKSSINTHVVKAALSGHAEVDTGIQEEAALDAFLAAKPGANPGPENGNTTPQRRIIYLLDKDIDLEHFLLGRKRDDSLGELEVCVISTPTGGDLDGSPIDLLLPSKGDTCPSCKTGVLDVQKTIELGHTFFLGARYSSKFNLVWLAKSSEGGSVPKPYEMGCHGIGVSRLVAAAARLRAPTGKEKSWSLQWPKAIAPYHISVICSTESAAQIEASHEIYDGLEREGFDVLLDDRTDCSFGWKLADIRILGIPIAVLPARKSGEKRWVVICPALEFEEDVQATEVLETVQSLMNRLISRSCGMSLPKNEIGDKWGSIRNKLSKDGAGFRLYPSRTPKNDAAFKGRLDQGEKLPKKDKSDQDEPNDSYNVNVQANNQGSARHNKLFTIQVKPSNTKEELKAKLKSAAEAKGLI